MKDEIVLVISMENGLADIRGSIIRGNGDGMKRFLDIMNEALRAIVQGDPVPLRRMAACMDEVEAMRKNAGDA